MPGQPVITVKGILVVVPNLGTSYLAYAHYLKTSVESVLGIAPGFQEAA
jgi:hypothetical protein